MADPASRTWSPSEMDNDGNEDFTNMLGFNDLHFSPVFDGSIPTDGRNLDAADRVTSAVVSNIDESMNVSAMEAMMSPMNLQLQMPGQHALGDHPASTPQTNSYPLTTTNFASHSNQGLKDGHIHGGEFMSQDSSNMYPLSMQLGSHQYQGMSSQSVNQQPHMVRMPTVPMTPNSSELHGSHLPSYTNYADTKPYSISGQQSGSLDQMRLLQQTHANFTPLVSPAVTPLDTSFCYADSGNSVESFTPLTSPALQGQNHGSHAAILTGSNMSATSSPLDFTTFDYGVSATNVSSSSLREKHRRKVSGSTAKHASRSVIQSPAMKPVRKSKTSTAVAGKDAGGLMEQARRSRKSGSLTPTSNSNLSLAYAQDSSGGDSVSPEPISDILMPPPAHPSSVPSTAQQSPFLQSQSHRSSSFRNVNEAPATPASLMKIRREAEMAGHGSRQFDLEKLNTEMGDHPLDIDDIMLPEPMANVSSEPNSAIMDQKTSGAKLETSAVDSKPKKSPQSGESSTASASPHSGAIAASKARKSTDSKPKQREMNKKRISSASEKASPALRPKISPSIKPLLPEGAVVSPDNSAFLLAAKSNYQNIIEGTHVPGVTYPENLSTNLSSKKTSHKLAEQGRRNRINTALQEIASLLPPQTPVMSAKCEAATPVSKTGNEESSSMVETPQTPNMVAQQQNNSKASTVEAAIDYIKSLQNEVETYKKQIADLERTHRNPPNESGAPTTKLDSIEENNG